MAFETTKGQPRYGMQTLNFELQTLEHAVFLLVVIAFDVNLYQSVVWLLMAKRNFYQSVLTLSSTIMMKVWLL